MHCKFHGKCVTIPRSTAVSLRVHPDQPDEWTLYFRCVDCGFLTDDYDEASRHQEEDRHTLWQKFKRWFGRT